MFIFYLCVMLRLCVRNMRCYSEETQRKGAEWQKNVSNKKNGELTIKHLY
jgi:hypothetical protein